VGDAKPPSTYATRLMLIAVRSTDCPTIQAFAQDPNFLQLDGQLLAEDFSIVVLRRSVVENSVSRHSFAFAATRGCEGDMLGQCEHRLPQLHLGLGLENFIHQDDIRLDDMPG